MKNDIEALAFMFSSIGLIILVTLLFSGAAQWMAGVAYPPSAAIAAFRSKIRP